MLDISGTLINRCERLSTQKIQVESRLSSVIERCKLTNGTRPAEVERENCLCCLVYLSFFYGNMLIVGIYLRVISIYAETKQTEMYFRLFILFSFLKLVTPFSKENNFTHIVLSLYTINTYLYPLRYKIILLLRRE